MTYASLYDIRNFDNVDFDDDYDFDRTDAEASGDLDDDIAAFFGGTVHIYHGGN